MTVRFLCTDLGFPFSQFHSSGVCKTRCDADRYTSPNELSFRSLRTYYTHRPNELSRPFPRADAPMLVRVPIAPASFLPRHFRAEIRQPVIHPGLHRSCHAALQGRMAAHRNRWDGTSTPLRKLDRPQMRARFVTHEGTKDTDTGTGI